MSFLAFFFFIFTPTWITEKELEWVIENNGDELCKKKNMEMRNASGQQGENEWQWKIKANMNTGNKILGKHIRQFLHTRKFDILVVQNSIVVVQNNSKGKTKCAARANLFFAN